MFCRLSAVLHSMSRLASREPQGQQWRHGSYEKVRRSKSWRGSVAEILVLAAPDATGSSCVLGTGLSARRYARPHIGARSGGRTSSFLAKCAAVLLATGCTVCQALQPIRFIVCEYAYGAEQAQEKCRRFHLDAWRLPNGKKTVTVLTNIN